MILRLLSKAAVSIVILTVSHSLAARDFVLAVVDGVTADFDSIHERRNPLVRPL